MDGLGKIVVVCGPTATGKSALALALARGLGGQLVNADSMQVYEGLVVGTAAVVAEEADGVPVHLSGTVPPQQAYSVAAWLRDATAVIEDITSEEQVPIVCGGTGLYIQSLVKGVRYGQEQADPALRQSLEDQWEADGGVAVRERLATLDPERADVLHPNDQKRIIRALEQVQATGRTARQREAESLAEPPRYDALCLGLNYESRPALYARCDARVDAMMARGLLDEAKCVWQNRDSYRTAAQAIGYKEFFPYLEGVAPLEACVDKLKQATRNYAKRQLTWFGGMEGIHWLQADDASLDEKALEITRRFLENQAPKG